MQFTFFNIVFALLILFLTTTSATTLLESEINTTSSSLTARQDFSAIYTGDLCLKPSSAGNVCFFSTYTNGDQVSLYVFRNTCELIGYKLRNSVELPIRLLESVAILHRCHN
jgi:hypothetical protein